MELAALDPLTGAMIADEMEPSTGDISVKQALAPPLMILVAMLVVAAGISAWTRVDGSRVFLPYLETWAASTLIVILFWSFVQVARLAAELADNPLQTLVVRVRERQRLFVLPAFIFPVFIGAYTWVKCSIPFAVGYGWEATWADLDRLIFGSDPWVLAHALSPPALASAWAFLYAVIWGFALVFSGTVIAAFAGRRFTATFFTALMLSWLIGGVLMAYLLSAAGPVFAHLADPALAEQFAPLRADLIDMLGQENLVLKSQRYLAAGMNVKVALKGGGISAMPSMHIATATIFICAAWRTRWLIFAILFWVMTFFGSVYLGYHYAIDAPVAAVIAICCWFAAKRLYRRKQVNIDHGSSTGRLPAKR